MLDIPLTLELKIGVRKDRCEANPDLLKGANFSSYYGNHGWQYVIWDMPFSVVELEWFRHQFNYNITRRENDPLVINVWTLQDLHEYMGQRVGDYPHSDFVNPVEQLAVLKKAKILADKIGFDTIKLHVKVDDKDVWKLHERLRFFRGRRAAYSDIPPTWRKRDFLSGTALDPRHPSYNFPHVSIKNPGVLAFTDDDDKGQRDIQTQMKPGKYLKQFIGEKLTLMYGENQANALIAQMAAEFGNFSQPEKLRFADTAEEMVRVYTHGPASCMSHATENYAGGVHPMNTLAAGDIQVAYIERRPNEVTARTIVWPEKKIWNRIYGDAARLRPLLEAQGYKASNGDGFNGARVAKIKSKNHNDMVIAAYIDGHPWAKESEDGSHLIIDPDGVILAQQTSGVADLGTLCKICEKKGRTNERMQLKMGGKTEMVCRPCFHAHTITCTYSGRNFPKEEMVQMAWGTHWHRAYFKDYGFTCAFDGKRYSKHSDHARYPSSRGAQCVPMDNRTYWHIDNFKKHGKKTKDGRNIPIEQWEAEESARLRKILEDAGQLTLDLTEDDIRKKVAALARREQRAAKKARDIAEAEALKKRQDDYEKFKKSLVPGGFSSHSSHPLKFREK